VIPLLIATSNAGKFREISAILHPFLPGVSFRSLTDLAVTAEIAETGATFAENAALKAIGYSELTGLPTLADDSGLEVIALGLRPGVFSARYGAPQASDDAGRIAFLLAEMAGQADRRARFVCHACLARGRQILTEAEGTVDGELLDAPRGTDGFGYDPIFFYLPLGLTFAELDAEQKNLISHRSNALRHLAPRLAAIRESLHP